MLINFPVSQIVGCRCTLLAGNSSISLAGSEEQIAFSQQSLKVLKIASESFILALLLFLGLLLKISLWVFLCRGSHRRYLFVSYTSVRLEGGLFSV